VSDEEPSVVRVVIVGSAAERARLRGRLPDGVEILVEAPTLAEARAAAHEVHAWLVAADLPRNGNDLELIDRLTHRELEVLELLAQGLSNRTIASRLAISDQTVKFHVASICGKLGAINRTDAVRRALRRQLIAV